jgi:hypothetical protein
LPAAVLSPNRASAAAADSSYELFAVVVHMGAHPNHGGRPRRSPASCRHLLHAYRRVVHVHVGLHEAYACLYVQPCCCCPCSAGHYVALVRTPSGQWVCFDDEQVNAITEAQVRTPAARLHSISPDFFGLQHLGRASRRVCEAQGLASKRPVPGRAPARRSPSRQLQLWAAGLPAGRALVSHSKISHSVSFSWPACAPRRFRACLVTRRTGTP